MSKLVSLVLNQPVSSGELTAAQSAAQAAADAVLARSEQDKVLTLPTETLAEQLPDEPVFQQPAAPTGSERALERVEQRSMEGEILQGSADEGLQKPGVFAEADPEYAQEQYLAQLKDEQTRPAEMIWDRSQGVITLPVSASKNNDGMIAKLTEDVSAMEDVMDIKLGIIGGGTTATPNPVYNALDALGMTEPASAGSKKKKAIRGVGGVGYLSLVAALASIENDVENQAAQHHEPGEGATEDQAAEAQSEGEAISRFVLAERVADAFEKLVTDPSNLDTTTGETRGVGTGKRVLNTENRRALGGFIVEAARANGMILEGDPDKESGAYIRERKIGNAAGKGYEYYVTSKGQKLKHDMSFTLGEMIPELVRPVSLTPLRLGEFVGERGTVQTKITRAPLKGFMSKDNDPNNPPPGVPSRTMQRAMDVMGTMPNIVSGHKVAMTDMMLNDIRDKKAAAMEQAKVLFNETFGVDYDADTGMIPKKKAERDDAQTALLRQYRSALMKIEDHVLGGMPFFEGSLQEIVGAAPDLATAMQNVAAATLNKEVSNNPLESPFAKLFGQDMHNILEIAESSRLSSRRRKEVYKKDDGKWYYKKSGKKDPKTGKTVTPEAEVTPTMQKYIDEKIKEKGDEVGDKFDIEIDYATRSPDIGGQSHRAFANEVVQSEMQKALKTRDDAMLRSGYEQNNDGTWTKTGNPQVFYYGVTAIGNSSRLMITNTELNYQANKLARFMVDNPRPSLFVKKGKKDKEFRYLTARALLADADKYSPGALLELFNTKETQESINSLAQRVYRASQANDSAALGAAVLEARGNKAIADEWEGNGEWGFQLDALHEWGKYLDAPDGSQLQTRLKAEVDGINNGSSIQGLQFGDKDILDRAGVLWEQGNTAEGGRESVIPLNNMRDFIFGHIMAADDDAGVVGLRDANKKYLKEIGGAEGAQKILNWIDQNQRKSFIKIPLMTTIYGKPHDKHGDHIRGFMAKNFGKMKAQLDLDDTAYRPIAAILTKAVSNGLSVGLESALNHQRVIKQTAGWMFNMMDEIPQIRGANGFVVQAGGSDYVMVPTESGSPTIAVKLYEMVDGVRGKPKKLDIAVHKTVPTAAAAKKGGTSGSITRNQLAVNGTHNIDATVAQETLIEARKRKQDQDKQFWGQQVFDAFIGDLDSLEDLLEIGNKKFYEINKRYKMVDEEIKAYQAAQKNFKERVAEAEKNGETWNIVGDESPFRVISVFGKRFFKDASAWDDHDNAQSFLEDFGFYVTENNAVALSENAQNKSPREVQKFVDFMDKHFHGPLNRNTMDSFRELKRQVDTNVEKYAAEIAAMAALNKIRQFN